MEANLLASRFKSHRNVVQGILDQLFPYSQDAPGRVLPQAEWLQDAIRSDSDQLRLLTRPGLWPTDLSTLCRDLARKLEEAMPLGESIDLNLPSQSYLVLTDGPRVVEILLWMIAANDRPYGLPTRLTVLEKNGRPGVTISTIPYAGGSNRGPSAGAGSPLVTARDSSGPGKNARRSLGLNLTPEDFSRALAMCRIECSIPGRRVELAFTPAPPRPPAADPKEDQAAPLEASLARMAEAQSELATVITRIRGFRDEGELADVLGRLRFGLENVRRDLDAAATTIETGADDRPVLASLKDTVRAVLTAEKDSLRRRQVRCHVEAGLRLPHAWIRKTRVMADVSALLGRAVDAGNGPRELWFQVQLDDHENEYRIQLSEAGAEPGRDGAEINHLLRSSDGLGLDGGVDISRPHGVVLGSIQIEDVISKGLTSLVPRVASLAVTAQEPLRVYKCQLLSGQDGDVALLLLSVQQQLASILESAQFPRCLVAAARLLPWQMTKAHRLELGFEQELATAWRNFPTEFVDSMCMRLIRGELERPTFAETATFFWIFGRTWTFAETRINNPLSLSGLEDTALTALGAILCNLDDSDNEPPHYIQRMCFRALNLLVDVTVKAAEG